MLLLSKQSFEECRDIRISRENRIPLTRWKRRKSSSVIVEIVVWLITTNFNHSANPIAREFHPVWQMRKITLSFSFLSRVSPIIANKQISNLFPHFSFSTILKSKRRNKTKQIQNKLCKCGWDFDHFDQFDQNHAFSNHNPKRMAIDFALRELIKICKNEKQNEWDFIPCLFSSLQKRKERKKKLSSSFSSFNKQLPFILTHSISSKQSQSITNNHNEKRKRWKWTSSTTIEQVENPIV